MHDPVRASLRTLAGLALVAALAACDHEIIDTWPVPVPPAEFGALTLTVTGGVAGIQDQMEVAPDGTVLVTGSPSVGGRAPARTMTALRELLTSEEIAAEAASGGPDQEGCADGFTYALRM